MDQALGRALANAPPDLARVVNVNGMRGIWAPMKSSLSQELELHFQLWTDSGSAPHQAVAELHMDGDSSSKPVSQSYMLSGLKLLILIS